MLTLKTATTLNEVFFLLSNLFFISLLPKETKQRNAATSYGFERTGTWFSVWLKNSHRYACSDIFAKATANLRAVRFANPSRKWQIDTAILPVRTYVSTICRCSFYFIPRLPSGFGFLRESEAKYAMRGSEVALARMFEPHRGEFRSHT